MDRKRPNTDDSLLKSPPGKILKTDIDSMELAEDISKLITLDSPDVSINIHINIKKSINKYYENK